MVKGGLWGLLTFTPIPPRFFGLSFGGAIVYRESGDSTLVGLFIHRESRDSTLVGSLALLWREAKFARLERFSLKTK